MRLLAAASAFALAATLAGASAQTGGTIGSSSGVGGPSPAAPGGASGPGGLRQSFGTPQTTNQPTADADGSSSSGGVTSQSSGSSGAAAGGAGAAGGTSGDSATGAGDIQSGQKSDPNRLHPLLQDRPNAAAEQREDPQFRGSGGKAGNDGSAGGTAAGGERIAGGSLVPLTEKERERIREAVLSENVAQEPRPAFKMRLGAKVPEDVDLRPLPQEVEDMVPQYGNFGYVLTGDRIVVVQLRSREIGSLIPIM